MEGYVVIQVKVNIRTKNLGENDSMWIAIGENGSIAISPDQLKWIQYREVKET